MTDYRPLARSAAAAALAFLILISGAHARDAETSDATRSFQRLMLLGESYKRIGKYDRALQKFRAAAKADPEAADKALLEIDLILTIQEQYQAAAEVFSKALAGKLDDEGEKQARRGLAVAVRAGKLDPQPYQSKHTKPWQLYASVAGEIVDGLAVEDQINLGLIVRESDKRLRYRFGGAYSVAVPGAGGKATLGYDFSQSVYSRFEAFDLQTHRGYFRYERALSDRFSFTGDYDFTFYRLGENSRALSSAHRIGVGGLYKLKPRHFLRSNVGYKYTNFRSFSQQDNRTTHGSIGYVYQLPTPLK
ncbi:MAG: hypothetical protein OXT06_29095, partial [Rhodospirillaceae bacterium]|nr:hypothetical protein [Rhodospirillaceae bacterium]